MTHLDIKDLVDTADGSTRIYSFRKTTTQTLSVGGFFFDWSMSPGNPNPQYYAASPLQATVLARSTDGGLQHGANVTPYTKYLRKIMFHSPATAGLGKYILQDYLMFYPFVDTSTNDVQSMSNTASLTRYSDGVGVQIMPVVVAPGAGTAGVTFTASYTNSDGVSGRTTRTATLATQTNVGVCAASTGSGTAVAGAGGPYMGLQDGDKGVRSIESITFPGTTDVGLLAFVLVRPLANFYASEIAAPIEIDYVSLAGGVMPIIKDDAYLGFVHSSATALASGTALNGLIETFFR